MFHLMSQKNSGVRMQSKNCPGMEGQSKENHDIWGCENCTPLTPEQEEEIDKGFDRVPTHESVDMYLPHEYN